MAKHDATNNCGVFVLKFIEYIILGRPISHIDKSSTTAHKERYRLLFARVL